MQAVKIMKGLEPGYKRGTRLERNLKTDSCFISYASTTIDNTAPGAPCVKISIIDFEKKKKTQTFCILLFCCCMTSLLMN